MPETIENPPLLLCPLGDSAVVLQFGEEISLNTHFRIRAVAQALEQRAFQGLLEYVPAYTTLTVYYNPWVLSQQGKLDAYSEVVRQLEILVEQAEENEPAPARVVELPVMYGGTYGPDLQEVAEHTGLSIEEIIRIHSSGRYQVYMIGFAPGFAYLGGMDERIATPRQANPRASIPAGSVGIAGEQTGVYPISTPGGWQLIGRTPLQLFDPDREVPSLLQAGDEVRFVPISEQEYEARKEPKV
ncbi:5-oxoprolinase subunit PxpB [Pontibacter anaerobius]|uniref:5-oxoprolinase subunit PxpB n=1 Tax=Pontibacter anaerobius TaxID=2993940 RepID=A0ABT3REU1_9BACT|nr:5-oxoprolinase subunit PxpB [Pontibacter anaerobius]MCX2740366.1 5-oxoprolinase subunit PxpB [Pontibacter anaerobius]